MTLVLGCLYKSFHSLIDGKKMLLKYFLITIMAFSLQSVLVSTITLPEEKGISSGHQMGIGVRPRIISAKTQHVHYINCNNNNNNIMQNTFIILTVKIII